MDDLSLERAAVWLVPLVIAIVGHELGHGYAARYFGDDTAAQRGRLSWNPVVHAELFGSVLLPLMLWFLTPVAFGWAKPVPVDVSKLRSPRRDMALVALAGPAANGLMALAWAFGWRLAMEFQVGVTISWMCLTGISLNIAIGLLNLLPVLPLDGGRIVSSALPTRWLPRYQATTLPAVVVLLALLFFGQLGAIIGPVVTTLSNAMMIVAAAL
jgi:Zn-dependent protease